MHSYSRELSGCGSWGSADLEGKITKSLKSLWMSYCLLAERLHNGIRSASGERTRGDGHLCALRHPSATYTLCWPTALG